MRNRIECDAMKWHIIWKCTYQDHSLPDVDGIESNSTTARSREGIIELSLLMEATTSIFYDQHVIQMLMVGVSTWAANGPLIDATVWDNPKRHIFVPRLSINLGTWHGNWICAIRSSGVKSSEGSGFWWSNTEVRSNPTSTGTECTCRDCGHLIPSPLDCSRARSTVDCIVCSSDSILQASTAGYIEAVRELEKGGAQSSQIFPFII